MIRQPGGPLPEHAGNLPVLRVFRSQKVAPMAVRAQALRDGNGDLYL
jgi:hypothetical protein